MSQADEIRHAALELYVLPARAAEQRDVIIRAGDLHRQMRLTSAMPAVCSALRSTKFEEFAKVRKLEVSGPANGANVYFRFALSRAETSPNLQVHKAQVTPRHLVPRKIMPVPQPLDFADALVLVSCVKNKLLQAAPARKLYCSDWFAKARHLVERSNARWFILSARHGFVPPDREIEPYELTLKKMDIARRRAWAEDVLKALEPELAGYSRVVFFAGVRYREFLAGPLVRMGLQVDVPMEGMAQGEQLSWLGAQS